MQKIFMTLSSDVKHIVTEKISFTHSFKSIATEKSIIFAFTFLKKDLMFDTMLKMTDQMIEKLAQTVIKNIS